MFLESKGYVFESETDTECIAKLVKHIRSQNPSYTFRQLVEQTISQVRVLISSRLCLFLTYFLLLHERGEVALHDLLDLHLEGGDLPGQVALLVVPVDGQDPQLHSCHIVVLQEDHLFKHS